jgi:hypothetical protein
VHRSIVSLTIPLLAALLALTGGCYDTPRPACAFFCGADGACPDGYRCAGDGWCKRMDVADGFVCAALPDAAPSRDAPGPAPSDAAASDASPVDAAPVDPADAMPTDPEVPDASLIDASFPDPDANDLALR